MVLYPKSVVKEGLIFSFEQKGRKKGSYLEILNTVDEKNIDTRY